MSHCANTFSICCVDPETGEAGIAVASKVLAVGVAVPYAMAGVGVIATQAGSRAVYGTRGLELLQRGLSAQQVVDRLTAEDESVDVRQLAVVDCRGLAATFNGSRMDAWAGSISGPGYSCQGNTLAGKHVLQAMNETFLALREKGASMVPQLFGTLKAGDAQGGDSRGKQSAAILVVRHGGHWTGSDRYCDLRVDDHEEPIGELGRILDKYAKRFHLEL